jgi:hypothetical protein
LLSARRTWPALRNWSERRARLIEASPNGLVLELVRGGTTFDAPDALVSYFNLTGQPQPLPAEFPESFQLKFSSEDKRYGGSGLPSERSALAPFECRCIMAT